MQQNNDVIVQNQVIVRAWGDEPVLLILYRIENNRVFVGLENCSAPIGLPLEQVYRYSLDKFIALKSAFACQDRRNIGEEWAKLAVDDFSCNKYKDNIKFSHDQEHITDSQGTASSDTHREVSG